MRLELDFEVQISLGRSADTGAALSCQANLLTGDHTFRDRHAQAMLLDTDVATGIHLRHLQLNRTPATAIGVFKRNKNLGMVVFTTGTVTVPGTVARRGARKRTRSAKQGLEEFTETGGTGADTGTPGPGPGFGGADSDVGCSCTANGAGGSQGIFGGLLGLGLLGLMRRRRRHFRARS